MNIWARENLHIWEVANWDFAQRSCEDRARLLEQFDIQHYAYLGTADPHGARPDINTSQLDIDAEIEALKRHGINVRAWQFWFNGDDPARERLIGKALAALGRHGIAPRIWVTQAFSRSSVSLLHPESSEGFPKTPEEQQQRIQHEANRIAALARAVAVCGCKVDLYNHQDWFGLMANQLGILGRLKEMGIGDVGLVYNFGHSFSPVHDDANAFAELWERIKPHVTAVNLAIFGPRELEMMRVIEQSGWQGAVGMFPGFGNMELAITSALWSLNWAAAQVRARHPN